MMAQTIDSDVPVILPACPQRKWGGILWGIATAAAPLRVVLFVLFFAVYLCFWVDMRLVFHARDKLFLLNFRYLTDFLFQPGALLEWADRLLVQLGYHGWPASLAMAAILWVLLISTIGFMNAVGRGRVSGTWIVPGTAVLVLYGQYQFHTSMIVGLAVAMTAASAWVRAPGCRTWLRMAMFIVIAIAVYYVTGMAGYGTFVACCAIREMLAERRWLFGVSLLGASAGVKFWVDVALVQTALACRYSPAFFPDLQAIVLLDWRTISLYAYFPVCELAAIYRQVLKAMAMALLPRFRRTEDAESSAEDGPKKKRPGKDRSQENRVRPEVAASSGSRWKWPRWAPSPMVIQAMSALHSECTMDVLALDTKDPTMAKAETILTTSRQGPAFGYGSAFSRGMALTLEGRKTIHVSGTASIDSRGNTLYQGNSEMQCLETLVNVAALLEGEGGSLRDIAMATLFCKTKEVFAAYRNVTRWLQMPEIPTVYVQADVCRPDLLVEMEALAFI